MYHLVSPIKYRRKVLSKGVTNTLKQICDGIRKRYEIYLVEIGTDENHVHYLVQSVLMNLPKQIVQTIKSKTAIQKFKLHPEVKELLWGGKFWTSGYYISTVGQYGNKEVIRKYVEGQGKVYKQLSRQQLTLL